MAQVKLLDFWAPWCIDLQTPVLTENGYVKASEVQVGQKLITIDPKTKKQSIKTVQRRRIFKDVPSKKVILETGRELIGDTNHLVLTQEGFKKLDDLVTGEKILVNPTNNIGIFQSDKDEVILQTTGREFTDKVLTRIGLLPLKSDNRKLPILAKLLGLVVTDGYLYEDRKHNICETHFSVGTEEDAEEIRRDLLTLGFEKLEVKRQIKKRQINGRDFTINCLRCRSSTHALLYLLKTLGSPVGRKKNQTYFVPDWIMNGGEMIKRKFMSGWIGGDGCKIDYRIKHGGTSSHDAGFNVNAIEFHKEKELEREGILYAKQLGLLFEQLGVEVKDISSSDDEDGVIISLRVATDYQSLFNLASIGYAYAKTKNTNVPFIREFLQYRLLERIRYAETKKLVLEYSSLGLGYRRIAQDSQLPMHTVSGWIYTNKDSVVVHPSEKGEALFTKWLEQRQQGDLLWEKVTTIVDTENRDVIGITVSNPHTIVTNGIVSHNCGPCKIMNPIIEELEKALGSKVKVGKINVDENSEMASKYGVMSIPTYIILKDDKEVGRKIGVTSKADLLKLLQS